MNNTWAFDTDTDLSGPLLILVDEFVKKDINVLDVQKNKLGTQIALPVTINNPNMMLYDQY